MKLLLNNGSYNGVTLFDKKILDKYIAPEAYDDTYATGWRRKGSEDTMNWMMGKYASPNTYGHTGFTGMDTIIDSDNDFGIILLTNRLQSQQLSKAKFISTDKYLTPNYGAVMTAVEETIFKN